MGKRVHGRLVHEVREALYRAGFMPARITQLGDEESPRVTHSAGFKVEKHNDGKSVRLFHVTAGALAGSPEGYARQSLERERVSSLLSYHAALAREGFTRIALDGRDRPAPYSIWRRADGSSRGLNLRDNPLRSPERFLACQTA